MYNQVPVKTEAAINGLDCTFATDLWWDWIYTLQKKLSTRCRPRCQIVTRPPISLKFWEHLNQYVLYYVCKFHSKQSVRFWRPTSAVRYPPKSKVTTLFSVSLKVRNGCGRLGDVIPLLLKPIQLLMLTGRRKMISFIRRPRSSHKCSVGLRSGLMAGQGSRSTPACWITTLEWCGRALSSSKMAAAPICWTAGMTRCCKISARHGLGFHWRGRGESCGTCWLIMPHTITDPSS